MPKKKENAKKKRKRRAARAAGGAEAAPSLDNKDHGNLNIFELLSSPLANQRSNGCHLLASAIAVNVNAEQFCLALLKRDVLKRLLQLLYDDGTEIRIGAAKAIRNLCFMGGPTVCELIIQKGDIFTPVVSVFERAKIGPQLSVGDCYSLFASCFAILHSICVHQDRAVSILSQHKGILRYIFASLWPFPTSPVGPILCNESAQLLLLLTEENAQLNKEILNNGDLMKHLMELLKPVITLQNSSGAMTEVRVPPETRVTAAGIILNLLKESSSILNSTLPAKSDSKDFHRKKAQEDQEKLYLRQSLDTLRQALEISPVLDGFKMLEPLTEEKAKHDAALAAQKEALRQQEAKKSRERKKADDLMDEELKLLVEVDGQAPAQEADAEAEADEGDDLEMKDDEDSKHGPPSAPPAGKDKKADPKDSKSDVSAASLERKWEELTTKAVERWSQKVAVLKQALETLVNVYTRTHDDEEKEEKLSPHQYGAQWHLLNVTPESAAAADAKSWGTLLLTELVSKSTAIWPLPHTSPISSITLSKAPQSAIPSSSSSSASATLSILTSPDRTADAERLAMLLGPELWSNMLLQVSQTRALALSCLGNLLHNLPPFAGVILSEPHTVALFQRLLAVLTYVTTDYNAGNASTCEEVAGALLIIWNLIKSHKTIPEKQTVSSIINLCRQAKSTDIRLHAIGCLSAIGLLPALFSLNFVIGGALLEILEAGLQGHPTVTLEVLSEALNALFDVYAEDGRHTEALQQLRLLPKLEAFQKDFGKKVKEYLQSNKAAGYDPVLAATLEETHINLREFIRYKKLNL